MNNNELLKKLDAAELIYLTQKLKMMGFPDELINDIMNLIFDTKDIL